MGARDVNGNPRGFFAGAELYIGVDVVPGPNVDMICSAHDLLHKFEPGSFDTVICCEMLEHDTEPWVSVQNFHELLKCGGHMIITSPANGFFVHRFPVDCFRFLEDAYREWMFKGFQILDMCTTPDPCICCLGRKA